MTGSKVFANGDSGRFNSGIRYRNEGTKLNCEQQDKKCIFVEMNAELDDKVRAEIILNAERVFETYGFSKVSMQDISKAAGKGRTTLYYYFSNKMDAFDAVFEKICRKIFDQCQAELKKDASLAANIENFHKKKLRGIKSLTQKFHLALQDLKKEPSLMFTKMRFLMDSEIKQMDEVIHWAIEKGEIAKLPAEDVRFLAEMIVVSFKSFEQEIVLFNRFPDLEAKLSFLSNLFYKGLR